MRTIALAALLALLLPACGHDWPPHPDGGTDWTPPARCADVDAGPNPVNSLCIGPVPPYVIPVVDAGTGAEDDSGTDPDADAG